jgi:hypothetical protein
MCACRRAEEANRVMGIGLSFRLLVWRIFGARRKPHPESRTGVCTERKRHRLWESLNFEKPQCSLVWGLLNILSKFISMLNLYRLEPPNDSLFRHSFSFGLSALGPARWWVLALAIDYRRCIFFPTLQLSPVCFCCQSNQGAKVTNNATLDGEGCRVKLEVSLCCYRDGAGVAGCY